MKSIRRFKLIHNEKGQTSVEYILMILVVVTVATSVFEKLEGYLITGPNSIKNQYLGTYKICSLVAMVASQVATSGIA